MILRRSGLLARFARSERGALTVEFVVIFPLLAWVYTAMFVFWDAYRTENVNLKSTYTIADMISREQTPIDEDYIDGARTIYAFLNNSAENEQLRVSVVSRRADSDGNEYLQLEWSHATEGLAPHTEVDPLEPIIPMMAVGDQVIVVDTTTDWDPAFNVGLPAMTLTQTVVTSPRFVGQVIWGGAGT